MVAPPLWMGCPKSQNQATLSTSCAVAGQRQSAGSCRAVDVEASIINIKRVRASIGCGERRGLGGCGFFWFSTTLFGSTGAASQQRSRRVYTRRKSFWPLKTSY